MNSYNDLIKKVVGFYARKIFDYPVCQQCFLCPTRLKVLNALITRGVLCSVIIILFLPVLLRNGNNSRIKNNEVKMQKENIQKKVMAGPAADTEVHAFYNHYLVVAESPRCDDSVIILDCMCYYTKE